mmetsp:Transcript_96054/g.200663  ORF Transcript_96054/g.200663 Transcript_96054/m.200663 type:complete len:683 (-) Transcript_96054:61-2109(-)|eukprot:CAMPEP_0206445254 /NCGR_PEP_ID=MMETSP0324_2-20121206/15398_1 /ASSEMBLY_ACC=CAM_ASM_000836 /TAXON_ID=2866 /ORGANISM="Crypthecodinium cohnii, Strain Seligo" /LENGTH=682 /DNA_ID=CAMNT_0053913433 /DNA_START=91 /DNA_END=2139 /DNA_ORIENTATION=-
MARTLLLPILAAAAVAKGSAEQVTPIAKVVQLLSDMKAKGIAEKETEANKFSAFSQWCTDQNRTKMAEIKAGVERAEMLSAEIQKAESEINQLSTRILELHGDVGQWTQDKKAASEIRDKEYTDFSAMSQDFEESLTALDSAIKTLKKQNFDRPQAELLQVNSALKQVGALKLVPYTTKQALTAFLQQSQPSVEEMPDDDLFKKNKEAYGYEFQSGGVIEMLEKLKDQFSQKKYDLEKEEMNSKHAFELLTQQLTDNTENANHEISKKTATRAETQELKAGLSGDLVRTNKDMDEDQKYLDETRALCTTKTADFESRQKLRGEELEAIAEAIEILSSSEVAGTGEKHLPSLLQSKKRAALAQLRSRSPLQDRISAMLSERAHRLNSKLLSLVSQRVSSDTFDKVKKMIRDLISKLMEEATSETEHKGWCDTELATNKLTRESKTEDVSKLQAEVEDLTNTISDLTQDIADLSSGVQELTAAMAQATSERASSKEINEETIKEAKAAQAAISQATSILKDFYAKSAEATAFEQQTPAEDAPETFTKPYKGMLPENGNVVDFLEVIFSDFARLESDTSTAEAMEVEAFKKFMFESEKDKALKENEIEHKQASRTNKETSLHEAKSELKATQEQLDKAMAYYEKLKPTCVDSGITYEERVKQREEEIQSLQEALQILTGTDVDLS